MTIDQYQICRNSMAMLSVQNTQCCNISITVVLLCLCACCIYAGKCCHAWSSLIQATLPHTQCCVMRMLIAKAGPYVGLLRIVCAAAVKKYALKHVHCCYVQQCCT